MTLTKVNFRLETRSDGFPPISVETLNGVSDREGLIRLDNTPFFAKQVALGDVVECGKEKKNGTRDFKRVHSRGGNSALSVLFIKQAQKEGITAKLGSLGCYCEYGEFGRLDMLAVCVEGGDDLREVTSYLEAAERECWISYAELCVWDGNSDSDE